MILGALTNMSLVNDLGPSIRLTACSVPQLLASLQALDKALNYHPFQTNCPIIPCSEVFLDYSRNLRQALVACLVGFFFFFFCYLSHLDIGDKKG